MCRYLLQVVEGVSIHTPTQGVTPRRNPAHRHTDRFNPHTHTGCDAYFLPSIVMSWEFQSTHPRRVWLCYHSSYPSSLCFNPHTHAGCDFVIIPLIRQVCVSIHTPTQGVTKPLTKRTILLLFQSTHPRRVWRCRYFRRYSFWWCFNPHTHAGCDLTSSGAWSYQSMFQSTHPRRVWHRISNSYRDIVVVSIHTPTQGVTIITQFISQSH